MKQLSFHYLLALVIFLVVFFFATPVSAHGDEPRIEISAESLAPGSVLELRGVDFEFEEEVALALIGTQYELPLSTVIADPEGIFLVTITLPAELTEGTYVVRATTDDHVVESAKLTIRGTADLGGGEGSEQEDGLRAPMPTTAANVSAAPVQAATPVEASIQKNPWMPVVWIAAGIGIVVMLGVLVRRRKS